MMGFGLRFGGKIWSKGRVWEPDLRDGCVVNVERTFCQNLFG